MRVTGLMACFCLRCSPCCVTVGKLLCAPGSPSERGEAGFGHRLVMKPVLIIFAEYFGVVLLELFSPWVVG